MDFIYPNGIDGTTGDYLVPPLSVEDLARSVQARADAFQVERTRGAFDPQSTTRGLPTEVEPTDASQAGWAVVFPENTSSKIHDALEPLIRHRVSHASEGAFKKLYYRPGESKRTWLGRHGVASGDVYPTQVPYYLLLVGEPAKIPFKFQCLLSVSHAVGRLAFDEPDHYRQYAESVVEYETGHGTGSRDVVFWGPKHLDEKATEISSDHLITPLAFGTSHAKPIAETFSFSTSCFHGESATKANLLAALHRSRRDLVPTVLFTASHGVGWPMHDPRHTTAQGALLSQDWCRPNQLQPAHYLAAEDVDDEANVSGLFLFSFACYSAGTPEFDNYPEAVGAAPTRIAEAPFVAPLFRRLLSHPNGSALAAVGHVDRAWSSSIKPFSRHGPQLLPFRNLIGQILKGEPVGHAMRDFSDRFAAQSADLLEDSDPTQLPSPVSLQHDAARWIIRNDARNYILLGDPAVRKHG